MARSSRKRSKKKSPKKKRRRISELNADNADKQMLYQQSVQDPEITVGFVDEIFGSRRERQALKLREDFCGTALFSAYWINSLPQRTAVGVDLDKETLDWGLEHNIAPLGDDASRISLLCENVLETSAAPEFDAIVAFNFSYWVFHERNVLLDYFRRVHESLNDEGMFVLDLHGGPDSHFCLEEPTDMGEFDYIWDQDKFDPITHRTICHIHFTFQDGSEMRNAFTYDWRVWSLPEIKDVLKDAGFSQIDVWWDEDNGDEEYRICETAENMEAFVAYIAAWK